MNTTNISVEANKTLEFLQRNFPEIIDCVPKDVLEFGIPNQYMTIGFAIFTTLLMIISIIMNSFIFSLYIRHKSLRENPSHKLVISIALFGILKESKSWVNILNGFYGGPIMGKIGCIYSGIFWVGPSFGEFWTIAAISYDQYRSVCSFSKANKLSHSMINVILFGIWSTAATVSLLPIFILSSGYVVETYLTACVMNFWSNVMVDRIFLIGLVIFGCIPPFLIVASSNISIFKFTLSTRESIIKQQGYSQEIEEFQVHDIKKSKSQKKLARTILQINLIFFSSFSPHLIIFVSQLIGVGHYVPKYVSMVAMFLCHFSSAINAIYYGLRLPNFKLKIDGFISSQSH